MINRSFGLTGLEKGYIFLPFPGNNIDKDSKAGIDYRDKIIKRCYRKQKVSIIFDNGTFANDCPISLSALRDIQFPEKFGQVGSTVVCWIKPLQKKPVILAVFGSEDDIDFSDEGDKKLSSIFKNSKAEVGIRGNKGEIYLNVGSTDENGGNIYINVSNTSNKGKLNIRVLGDSEIYTQGNCNISSSGNINIKTRDEESDVETSLNIANNEIKIISTNGSDSSELNINLTDIKLTNLKVGSANSPIPKGDELKTQLNYCKNRIDTLIQGIQNAPVLAGDGGATFKAGIVTALQAIANTEDYSNINSSISFTE